MANFSTWNIVRGPEEKSYEEKNPNNKTIITEKWLKNNEKKYNETFRKVMNSDTLLQTDKLFSYLKYVS